MIEAVFHQQRIRQPSVNSRRHGLDLPRPVRALPRPPRAETVSSAPGSGLQPELKAALDHFVQENKIVLFMKGTKAAPQCGFSATVCGVLGQLGVDFVSVNILEDELLRSGLKEYSSWPTFPQLYIDGEFFGGCDITIQAYQSGELAETIERALNS